MGTCASPQHREYFHSHPGSGARSRVTADGRCPSERVRRHVRQSLDPILMRRHVCQPRLSWVEKVEAIGLTYHSHDHGPYWDESACYEFTSAEIVSIEAAAHALHYLCIEAAERSEEHTSELQSQSNLVCRLL